jgi:hypothetical protein
MNNRLPCCDAPQYPGDEALTTKPGRPILDTIIEPGCPCAEDRGLRSNPSNLIWIMPAKGDTAMKARISIQASSVLLLLTLMSAVAFAEVPRIPVLVPITGFLSLEGTAQRNGAVMALEEAIAANVSVAYEVSDTSTSPEAAVTAMERALRETHTLAVVGPILGTQMLAMLPLAEEYLVPLVTISGTAKLTAMRWRNSVRSGRRFYIRPPPTGRAAADIWRKRSGLWAPRRSTRKGWMSRSRT